MACTGIFAFDGRSVDAADGVGRSRPPGPVEQPDVDAAASGPSSGPLAGRETISDEEAETFEQTERQSFDEAPTRRRSRHLQRLLARRGQGADADVAHHRSARRPHPALTPEAQTRLAAERAERSKRGPADSYADLTPVDALHLARLERHRQLVQQQLPDLPVARLRRRLSGADSRAAHHPARRPAASSSGRRAVARRLARPLGGQHARRRDHQLRSEDELPGLARDAARWSSATRRATPTISTTSSRSTIRRPSPGRGPSARPMRRQTGGISIFEYACHEGNYAMPGILRGARTEERGATKSR